MLADWLANAIRHIPLGLQVRVVLMLFSSISLLFSNFALFLELSNLLECNVIITDRNDGQNYKLEMNNELMNLMEWYNGV